MSEVEWTRENTETVIALVNRLADQRDALARRLEMTEHVVDSVLNDRIDSATIGARNYRRTFKVKP